MGRELELNERLERPEELEDSEEGLELGRSCRARGDAWLRGIEGAIESLADSCLEGVRLGRCCCEERRSPSSSASFPSAGIVVGPDGGWLGALISPDAA